jgi:hypothetical protein
MKVIFLDIDGVLNSQLYYEKIHDDASYDPNDGFGGHLHDIDPQAVSFLNDLVNKTDSCIVISSTWRGSKSLDYLRTILKKRGLEKWDNVIGVTPHCGHDCVRGNEILKWVKDNKELLKKDYYDFDSYVILDDDSDMLYWQRENFLLVDGYVGLTPNVCYKAVHILNRYNDAT